MDCFLLFLHFVLFACHHLARKIDAVTFNQNYHQTYGGNHLTLLEGGNNVQLLIDQSSGAGFSSNNQFGSGYFGMKMKLPTKNTTAIVTTFYLTSVPPGQSAAGNHYEFDMEFLGAEVGAPHKLSTNVFANDRGGREQVFNLWFDATANFHLYEMLWNSHQFVFFVDGTPIRIFKNLASKGVGFPTGPLHVEGTIWNAVGWLGNADWAEAPFTAQYTGFTINGCTYQQSNPQLCNSASYFWNAQKYWQLSAQQETALRNARKSHMTFDYCNKYAKQHIECSYNL